MTLTREEYEGKIAEAARDIAARQDSGQLAKDRSCGSCRLCCKLLGVHEKGVVTGEDEKGLTLVRDGVQFRRAYERYVDPEPTPDGIPYEFHKPPFRWCEHACDKGCSIYGARPMGCRDFSCLWLVGHFRDEDRPDKLRMVVSCEGTDQMPVWFVYEDYRGAHRARTRSRVVMQSLLETGIPIVVFSPESVEVDPRNMASTATYTKGWSAETVRAYLSAACGAQFEELARPL